MAATVDIKQGPLEAHGIRVSLPEGWSGRLFRLPDTPPDRYFPVLHAGNFAISLNDSAFGQTLAADVRTGRVVFMYVEYAVDDALKAGTGLYQDWTLPPTLRPEDFTPKTLQLGRPGQVGYQAFFTISDARLGVIYIVLGQGAGAERLCGEINQLIDSLEFTPTIDGTEFRRLDRRPR